MGTGGDPGGPGWRRGRAARTIRACSGFARLGECTGQQTFHIQGLAKIQPEVGSHGGSQHLGRPQCRRAWRGPDLPDAQRAGRAQDAADITRVLKTIEQYRRCRGVRGLALGQSGQEHHPGWRQQRADLLEHPIGHEVNLVGPGGQFAHGSSPPGGLGNRRHPSPMAACEEGRAQMLALDADQSLLAVGRRLSLEPAQALQQRVAARRDRRSAVCAHGLSARHWRTGAKLSRCRGQGPCRRKA